MIFLLGRGSLFHLEFLCCLSAGSAVAGVVVVVEAVVEAGDWGWVEQPID